MEVTADSKVFPRTPLRLRGFCALILGSVLLVSMTTASSPIADGPPLVSNVSKGILNEALRTDSPSAFAHSQASGHPGLPLHTTLPPLGTEPPGNQGNGTGSPMPTQWGLSPSRHTKASTTRDPSHPDRGLGSTPPLGSSDLTGGSNGQSESQNLTVPGPSLLPSTSGSLDQRSPAPQAALSSSPVSLDTPESNSTLSQPNASAPPAHTPPSRTTRSVATAPGFTVPKSLFGTPEGSLPLLTLSAQQGPLSGSDKPSVVTPVPPETAPAAFAPQRGPAYKVSSDYSSAGKASSSPPVSPTARSVGLDRLHSSRDPTLGDAAQGIHLLLNPPEVIAPSQVPVIRPHTTSATPEPTIVPPEEFYPTHTMEDDWGSGDYLETMSFMGPDGEDFSLVTSLPTELYDLEDSSSEVYDTSFPSRIVPALSSLHISSSPTLTSSYGYSLHTAAPMEPHPSHSGHPSPEPPVTSQNHGPADEGSDLDWADTYTIEPTEILLPDMNSLEYYTTLLAKENASAAGGRVNVTSSSSSSGHYGSLVTAHISPTRPFTAGPGHAPTASANTTEAEDSSADASGSGAVNTTAGDSEGVVRPHPADPLEPSVAPTPSMIASSSLWGGGVSAAPTPLPGATSSSAASIRPTTSLRPGGKWPVTATSTETILRPTATVTPHTTPKLTIASSSPPGSGVVADQGSTSEAPTSGPALTTVTDRRRTTTTVRTSTVSAGKTTTVSTTTGSPSVTTPRPPQITTARQYLCNITKTETYYVRVELPSGVTVGYAKSLIREVLKSEFNRSVELQIVKSSPEFIFRVVSGPVIYTAIAVTNAIRQSSRTSSAILSVSPVVPAPDHKYQVHSVLQFVPSHIDVRICNFSERIEKGLTMAYGEVLRRSMESTNFTVQIVNITTNVPKAQRQQRAPVDITFAMHESRKYLRGSDVSAHLRLLNMVEFSFYLGFPVLQIAEPFHYPELNVTQLLRSSWVRTVLLGVLDQRVNERTFQAKMERRLAQLLGEVLGSGKRWKRATSVGNNSVQIVRTSRLEGADHPLEMVYFVEGPSGERIPAVTTSSMLNQLDVQKAAIVLGYRVQGTLAQPVEKMAAPPSETQSNNMWIIVGVVVPVLVVIIIIIILYWKLCRSDKLEFQPDAMATVQQRQKSTTSLQESIPPTPPTQSRAPPPGPSRGGFQLQVEDKDEEEEEEEEEEEGDEEEDDEEEELQAPSVKGFDFAKLHLGQHSKDDIMVIQEPAPLPVPVKEVTPSENGDVPTPKSKTSSTKASRAARRRGRISPSDGDSLASDPSSGRESTEENLRPPVTPGEGKQPRKTPKNGKNKIGPPPANGTDEQLSSASIFEHVDRMSRSTDGTRRVANKIQLIAMQPMPAPPQHSPAVTERIADSAKINKEIQVALRHKSEIEHHRNKIRLRAKRRGHYDFPAMDDIMDTFGDLKDHDQIYQKAQMQIDKILDPDAHMPSIFMDPRKSSRGKRSPKQRKKPQVNGRVVDDKDKLIPTDSDGTYRKYPGVNNVAYVSDPDQLPEVRSPSPNDDVFLAPGSPPPGPAPAPPPYVPPQPSIEEARQQMHSLLDDAFALVSPSSQGSTPGLGVALPGSSPPARTPRGPPSGQWGSTHPSAPALSPFSARYAELGISPPSVQSLLQRQGLGSGGYLPPVDPGRGDQLQPEALYSSRAMYTEELPSSARPRPVGGTTGAQLHHLTQVGLSSRIGAYPGASRVTPGQTGSSAWSPYRPEEEYSRSAPVRDTVLGSPDSSGPSLFQMPRTALREPSAPPAHLDPTVSGYPPGPSEENSPPGHSSASLIKAIREELMRLSQKQSAVPNYHG